MSDDRRTTPFGVWRNGYSYLKAAKTLDDADANPRFTSDVTHQCVCQGIELAFKSYMLAKGKTLHDLKAVGPSLMRCMDAAVELGLTAPSADHRQVLAVMDRYYSEHEFRYIVTGSSDYPALRCLLSVGTQVLRGAAPAVSEAVDAPDLLRGMRFGLSTDLGPTPPK
jgi:hypothetical protein